MVFGKKSQGKGFKIENMKIKINRNKEPLSWLLWHPHQGFWNWTLVRVVENIVPILPINKLIIKLIRRIDTIILFLRVLTKRVCLLGATSIFKKVLVPDNISVIYIDVGTHKDARELILMVDEILPRMSNNFESYGFEASRESFEQAKEKLNKKNNVNLFNRALCYELPVDDGKIKLYKDSENGIGDSLYGKGGNYEEVEAMRLSDFFSENHIDIENSICFLRMNIEGAEYDVVKDLVDNMFAKHIDGYFGMWDDLSKIDVQHDKQFRDFLSKNQIYSVTFNGRDMGRPLRVKCIEYAVNTSAQVGLRKIQEELKEGKV